MSGDGRLVTTPVQGWFGEIALLRRVPRTAMVRAATDRHLQALRCNRFLPVVTGFRRAREAGTSVEEMLEFRQSGATDDENGSRH